MDKTHLPTHKTKTDFFFHSFIYFSEKLVAGKKMKRDRIDMTKQTDSCWCVSRSENKELSFPKGENLGHYEAKYSIQTQ